MGSAYNCFLNLFHLFFNRHSTKHTLEKKHSLLRRGTNFAEAPRSTAFSSFIRIKRCWWDLCECFQVSSHRTREATSDWAKERLGIEDELHEIRTLFVLCFGLGLWKQWKMMFMRNHFPDPTLGVIALRALNCDWLLYLASACTL